MKYIITDDQLNEIKALVEWNIPAFAVLKELKLIEPLTDKQIAMAWMATKDPIAVGGKFETPQAIRDFVRAIESAITGGQS